MSVAYNNFKKYFGVFGRGYLLRVALIPVIAGIHPEKPAFHRIESVIDPVSIAIAISFFNNSLGVYVNAH